MRRFVAASRVVVTLSCVSVLTVGASTAHAAGPTTAWHAGQFKVDTANLVRRSNIVLGRAPLLARQSMNLGNGSFGVAAWAANGFTAQLNRADTLPNHRSAGQLVIPGLAAMTGQRTTRRRSTLRRHVPAVGRRHDRDDLCARGQGRAGRRRHRRRSVVHADGDDRPAVGPQCRRGAPAVRSPR